MDTCDDCGSAHPHPMQLLEALLGELNAGLRDEAWANFPDRQFESADSTWKEAVRAYFAAHPPGPYEPVKLPTLGELFQKCEERMGLTELQNPKVRLLIRHSFFTGIAYCLDVFTDLRDTELRPACTEYTLQAVEGLPQ
jgi:hypothetical protein